MLRAAVIFALTLAALAAAPDRAVAQDGRPANDDIKGARIIFTGVVEATTAGATLEPEEPQPCAGMDGTIWFIFAPQATGDYAFDTTGSDFRTSLGVFELTDLVPSPPGGSLVPVTSACGEAVAPEAATVGKLTRDRSYVIQVGGIDGESGDVALSVACDPVCLADNDGFGDAIRIEALPYGDTVLTDEADLEDYEPQPCGGIAKTVWYVIENRAQGQTVAVSITANGDFPVVLATYRQDGLLSSPPGALTSVDCATAAEGQPARLHAELRAYERWAMQIGGVDGAGGRLQISVTCDEEPCALDAPNPLPDPTRPPIVTGPTGPITAPETGSGGSRR